MKFGNQSRQNTLFFNALFGIDDLALDFGPTMKVLSKFKNFGTKNKWNIPIDIHYLGFEQFHFKIEICSLLIHKTWN